MISTFKKQSRFGVFLTTSAQALAISSPFIALAANAQDEPAAKKKTNRLLEEVVVTAQKREENSQDVPITMAAIGGEKLEAFGIEDTADLQKITPGLTFTEQYGYTLIYLRGVGSEAFLPNAEPSVATYIDNINIAGSHGKQDAIGPVERIEVLKGPQGTLFGRSATGGAISIISKALPTEGYTAELTYNRGNYEAEHILFYGAAALTEDLAASISYYEDEREPFGKNVLFGTNVQIGNNTYIGSNSIVESNVMIGENCVIGSFVTIKNSLINAHVHIKDGAKIGVRGFGFIPIKQKNLRTPQIGKVILEEGVEIGANCTVDRGSVTDTIIGKNTFLDNLIHIAHNVKIGEDCMLAAQVGIAGSTIIGNNVMIGGQAGISGHLKIGNNVKIGGASGVSTDLADNSKVMGYPAMPMREFAKLRKKQ